MNLIRKILETVKQKKYTRNLKTFLEVSNFHLMNYEDDWFGVGGPNFSPLVEAAKNV